MDQIVQYRTVQNSVSTPVGLYHTLVIFQNFKIALLYIKGKNVYQSRIL